MHCLSAILWRVSEVMLPQELRPSCQKNFEDILDSRGALGGSQQFLPCSDAIRRLAVSATWVHNMHCIPWQPACPSCALPSVLP